MIWFLSYFAPHFLSISLSFIFFFSCYTDFLLISQTAQEVSEAIPMPQGSPQDLVLCLPLSPVMLEVVEHMPVPRGFCLLYPSPNHSITVRTQVLFLKVSIGLPLDLPQFMSYFWVCWVSQALTLSSYPWLVLLRLRSKPDVGWETPDSQRAHKTHCSELTQTPSSENLTVLILECMSPAPHNRAKTLTWHRGGHLGQPSWYLQHLTGLRGSLSFRFSPKRHSFHLIAWVGHGSENGSW